MSFALPYALLLLLPLAALAVLARAEIRGFAGRLPGMWQHLVSAELRPLIALRSNLGAAGAPILCFVLAALLVVSLARPGVDADEAEEFATLAGRVVVLDVGADLVRHRHTLDALHSAGPGIATAVVAVTGDAYRIVPFTTDKSQIDRYVRVLNAAMMPEPGQRPHLGLARAEQMLRQAGYPLRQVILLTARPAPAQSVDIPATESERIVVPLGGAGGWQDWAAAQGATVLERGRVAETVARLKGRALELARTELPAARFELTGILIGLTALLWLLLFRRRAA